MYKKLLFGVCKQIYYCPVGVFLNNWRNATVCKLIKQIHSFKFKLNCWLDYFASLGLLLLFYFIG